MANKFDKTKEWNTSLGEVRKGAVKYVEAIVSKLENLERKDPFTAAKELSYMGYAVGVVAGGLSDMGIEGFTLVLNGIMASLKGEERKEEMMYAVWDKNGDMHTSDESWKVKKEDEQ